MRPSESSFNDFLRFFAVAFLSGGCALIALVVFVDPYGIYGMPRLPGMNMVKPGPTRYQTEIKHQNAVAGNPRLLIFGNSRADIGFDPSAIPAESGPGYNLAIAGTGLSVSAKQLRDIVQAGIYPQTMIVGVEFIDFLQNGSSPAVTPVAAKPDEHGPDFWRFDTLFSLLSVKDAIQTLRIQHDAGAPTIAPTGFNPLKEYLVHVRNDGYPKIFRQRAQENAANFQRKSKGRLELGDFNYLREMVSTAIAGGADVKLLIYPYHAQMLAQFEQYGLWPLFEEWKRHLVDEIASIKREHPSARITLTDFSGFSAYNCDIIPQEGDRKTVPRWYWEGGHFKKQLGDLLLERLMVERPRQNAFGFALDEKTLTSNQVRIAAERAECVARQPALFLPPAPIQR